MISTRSVGLVIDTVVCLTLDKWETVSGQFGGYLNWLIGHTVRFYLADGNSVEIFNGTVDGNATSWNVSITEPMPMTLEFNGTISDDELTGSVILGDFGSSTFSGTRS